MTFYSNKTNNATPIMSAIFGHEMVLGVRFPNSLRS